VKKQKVTSGVAIIPAERPSRSAYHKLMRESNEIRVVEATTHQPELYSGATPKPFPGPGTRDLTIHTVC